MNNRLAEANSSLKSKINKYTSGLAVDIEANTSDAYTYLQANMDELKYLLSAYMVGERHEVLINHLQKLFGIINVNKFRRICNANGIYTKKAQSFYVYQLFGIICLCIISAVISYKIFYGMHTGILAVAIILSLGFYLFIGAKLEDWVSSTKLTYKLSDQYKYMDPPEKDL